MDSKETGIYTIILITGAILAVIIGYFVISIIRQQRRNLELQKQLILAEIKTLETERTRIASDLHDDLGPLLSVIKFRIDNERGDNEELAMASEQLDAMISRMREIANNMMPSALQRKGLIPAIAEYLDNVEHSGKLQIQFSHPEQLAMTGEKSIHVYRLVQEIVHNCIKHAAATEMSVALSVKNNILSVRCKDNGKGFDQKMALANGKGIGLTSLRNRTEILEGTLIIESQKGSGTAVLLEIPVT